jgi:hypothetical protein
MAKAPTTACKLWNFVGKYQLLANTDFTSGQVLLRVSDVVSWQGMQFTDVEKEMEKERRH